MGVYEELLKKAKYALMNESLSLVYETYGSAKMARSLGAITHNQFIELNGLLVRNGINNPKIHLE